MWAIIRFDAGNPGLGVVFEVYYHHLERWSRENDEAEANGTEAARANSGRDHHLQFVGHSTYVLPPVRTAFSVCR